MEKLKIYTQRKITENGIRNTQHTPQKSSPNDAISRFIWRKKKKYTTWHTDWIQRLSSFHKQHLNISKLENNNNKKHKIPKKKATYIFTFCMICFLFHDNNSNSIVIWMSFIIDINNVNLLFRWFILIKLAPFFLSTFDNRICFYIHTQHLIDGNKQTIDQI